MSNTMERQTAGARARGRYGQRRVREGVPHSAEAEEQVLAACLLEGDGGATLARARAAGVSDESFYLPQNREIWCALLALADAGREVSVLVLMEELRVSGRLSAVGGSPYLMQVTSSLPTTAMAGYFIGRVNEYRELRALQKAASRLSEGVDSYSGGGLADHVPLVEAMAEIEQLRGRQRGELPPVLKWADFVPAEQSKLPDELVAGLLHRGAKMMIAGGSKSFKTWVLLHLGLSVASGTPWWGMKVVRGDVLYVNMELMREFCEVRVRQIAAALKLSDVAGFHSWHLRGYARDFKELLPHFVARMARGQYSLIILDPVYKILGERDENANGEVAQLLNEFEALAVRTGAAVAYGHHHSKGNQSEKDARDRSSGAGAWTRDPDALIDLVPHEEDEHFTATFTLRNCPPKTPIVTRWEFPVMSIAPGMDPTALRKAGRPKENGIADVVTLLMGHHPGLTYGEWETAARNRGMSESTFKRLMKKAQEGGAVEKVGGIYRQAEAKKEAGAA